MRVHRKSERKGRGRGRDTLGHSCNAFRRQVARKNYVAREMLQQIRCSNVWGRKEGLGKGGRGRGTLSVWVSVARSVLLRVAQQKMSSTWKYKLKSSTGFVRFINIFTCASPTTPAPCSVKHTRYRSLCQALISRQFQSLSLALFLSFLFPCLATAN